MMINIIILSFVFLFVCITMAIIPYLTRKTENFGVSIPASYYYRQDFKVMRKKYTSISLGIGLLFFLILLWVAFSLNKAYTEIFFTTVVIVYLIISFVLYIPFHLKMKKIKVKEAWYEHYEQKTVIDLSFHNEKVIYSNWYFIIPGLLWATSCMILIVFQHQLPGEIPVNIGLGGEINYKQTSLKVILLLPVIQLFLLVLFIGMNMIIKQAKQQIHAENPKKSRKQNMIYRRRWSAFTIITGTMLQLVFLFQQLAMFFDGLMQYMNWIIFILSVILILAVLMLAITTGQGGSRVKIEEKGNHEKMDRDQDKYWKLGQFYVNQNDPSVFVEKRFGVGWTNNWAHPISWLLIMSIFAISGIIIWLSI